MTIALIHHPAEGTPPLAGVIAEAFGTEGKKDYTLRCFGSYHVFEAGAPDADIIFLEVNSMLDVEVGRKLHQLGPKSRLVVVSNSSDYSLEAFAMGARQYLVQPVTAAQLHRAVHRCFV